VVVYGLIFDFRILTTINCFTIHSAQNPYRPLPKLRLIDAKDVKIFKVRSKAVVFHSADSCTLFALGLTKETDNRNATAISKNLGNEWSSKNCGNGNTIGTQLAEG
jgi:hypothetical protein